MSTKIFVTVGSTYPLNRLIKEIDKIGENKSYEIFAQIGESDLILKNIAFKKFLTYMEMQSKMKWADLIISHAGAGSIIELLVLGKPFILFPRLKKFGEAVDDHQVEICKAFEKKYNIKYTTEQTKLLDLIKNKKANSK